MEAEPPPTVLDEPMGSPSALVDDSCAPVGLSASASRSASSRPEPLTTLASLPTCFCPSTCCVGCHDS